MCWFHSLRREMNSPIDLVQRCKVEFSLLLANSPVVADSLSYPESEESAYSSNHRIRDCLDGLLPK